MERKEVAEAGGGLHLAGDVTGLLLVDLVEHDHHRHPEREHRLGDEPIAGADPLLGGEHEDDGVHILERFLDRVLHALGQRVERALESG